MQNVEILFQHLRSFHHWPIAEDPEAYEAETLRTQLACAIVDAYENDIRRDAKAVSLRKALNALRYVTNPEEVKS
jgi:hypothetical protein